MYTNKLTEALLQNAKNVTKINMESKNMKKSHWKYKEVNIKENMTIIIQLMAQFRTISFINYSTIGFHTPDGSF